MLTDTALGLDLTKSNFVQSIVRLMEDAWKHSPHWQLSRNQINGNFHWFAVDASLFGNVSTMTNLFWTWTRVFCDCGVALTPQNERSVRPFLKPKLNCKLIFNANIATTTHMWTEQSVWLIGVCYFRFKKLDERTHYGVDVSARDREKKETGFCYQTIVY